MLKFTDKVVGVAKVERHLTEQDVESIMVGGIEGGIGYWAGLDNEDWERPKGEPLSMWATKLLLDGKEVKFYDVEDDEERWSLTLEKLVKGYALNAEKRSWDSSLEDGDSDTYDAIIQFALFGKIVYG